MKLLWMYLGTVIAVSLNCYCYVIIILLLYHGSATTEFQNHSCCTEKLVLLNYETTTVYCKTNICLMGNCYQCIVKLIRMNREAAVWRNTSLLNYQETAISVLLNRFRCILKLNFQCIIKLFSMYSKTTFDLSQNWF